MGRYPASLDDVLKPESVNGFIGQYLGKEFHYFPGWPGKFGCLLPWPDLNRILEQHRLDAPRLRLVREGKQVPPSSFTTYEGDRVTKIPRLRAADMNTELRSGATLIVDAVDELQQPVAELAESLERSLRCRVQVNLYAGWRTSRGFDLHWDGHDVLILQVAGRKDWKVYPKTRAYPLPNEPKTEDPPEAPLWEGTLTDGDALYIPRGWWHVALPLDEPTLHLTVGLHVPTGADFLNWFVNRLRGDIAFPKDLPILGNSQEKAERTMEMKKAWESAWTCELLDAYVADTMSRRRSRFQFGLPWTATAQLLPEEGDWAIHWIPTAPPDAQGDNSGVFVRWGGARVALCARCTLPTGTPRRESLLQLHRFVPSNGGNAAARTIARVHQGAHECRTRHG